jgi:hypothetical protein
MVVSRAPSFDLGTADGRQQAVVTRESTSLQRVAAAVLVLFGFGICLTYGHFGLNTLDHSIVWDGAWRMLSGQLPFRDFTTPIALVPIAIQSAIFAVLGVNWFAYCLHAAVMNGLFGFVTLSTARRLGASFWPSWLAGLASVVMLYPPIGVPFSEQHSFFFSTCCLWATLVVIEDRSTSGARTALVAAPMLAALALLSKLVPAGFVVPPCLAITTALGLRRRPLRTVIGLLLPVLLVALYVVAAQASVRDIVYYMFTLPLLTANARTVLYPYQQTDALLGLRLHYVVLGWSQALVVTGALLTGLWTTTLVILGWRRLGPHESVRPDALVPLALSVWLFLVTMGFVYVTNNVVANGLAFMPLVTLLAWMAFSRASAAPRGPRASSWQIARTTVAVLVLIAAASDLWRFNQVVNAGRLLTRFGGPQPQWSPGGRLQFLRMQRWTYAYDVRDILFYISQRPDNFLLFGDAALLYGATGHPSVFPALFMHSGLTMPLPSSNSFPAFEERVLANIQKYHVRYLIQEADLAHMGGALDDFPRIVGRVADCPMQKVGAWRVREICR